MIVEPATSVGRLFSHHLAMWRHEASFHSTWAWSFGHYYNDWLRHIEFGSIAQ